MIKQSISKLKDILSDFILCDVKALIFEFFEL